MAFFVKLPSLSSFSPRPQRRAASPAEKLLSVLTTAAKLQLTSFLKQWKVLVFVELTLPQQLVGLAHAVLDEALTVVQRLDAVRLDGVHLSEQVGQPLRQQPARCRLQLCKVPPEGLAGLTRTAPNLRNRGGRGEEDLCLLLSFTNISQMF